jgi:hypothetical protein
MIKRRRKSGRGASTGFLLVVLVICVVIFVTYWNGRGVGDDTIVGIINEKPTRVQDLVRTKNDVTSQLEYYNLRGKYGVWPIIWSDVRLDTSRENPFIKKKIFILDDAERDSNSFPIDDQLNN